MRTTMIASGPVRRTLEAPAHHGHEEANVASSERPHGTGDDWCCRISFQGGAKHVTTSRAHHTSLVSFHSTAAPAGLHSRPDSVVASAEQASEPLAGFRMVHSTYRKDLRAGAASPADQLAPAILLPSHHGTKATLCGQMCALRASRAPLVRAVDVPGAVAGPGTLGTAPAGLPGPRRSLDGPDIGAVPPSGLAHH